MAVIAILALLASLAVGAATLVATSTSEWRAALAREATIQVRPVAGRDLEADVARAVELARGASGIRDARALPKADAERLLEPWLGQGLDLSDLPVPRLIVLTIDLDRRPDLASLATRLVAAVPGATLDDHSAWLARLSLVSNAVTMTAFVVVLLIFAASTGAIAFATRGAIAGHRDIVEVLHVVGATDRFIARAFARRFAWAGLRGGIIGAIVAMVLVGAATILAGQGAAKSDLTQMQILFGSYGIGWGGYAAILAVGLADGAVAGLVSGAYVRRFLATLG